METATTTNKFAVELLFTDTICWEVVASTAKTLTLREMMKGAMVSTSGGSCPIVRTEALPNPHGRIATVRLRKDGTYRIRGGHILRFTDTPVFRTDYSF
jgi:hypothetical protein